ncbi:MAG: hypothetical protein C0623_04480 [Desulfuromonas sp.]|nr:MAG: hypothetical protein C0623_04480 [Desulfuromonas sp.]
MHRLKIALICILTAGISLFAASYRFGDSAHAIGMLNMKGGKVRHPFMLKSGRDDYTLIMTGIVLPPVQGDVRVALEGQPAMRYSIYNSEPIVKLDIHRQPGFNGEILNDVRGRDRLALWVVMQPQTEDSLLRDEVTGKPGKKSSGEGPHGERPLSLNFYADDSGNKLLGIPVVFADLHSEGGSHGTRH